VNPIFFRLLEEADLKPQDHERISSLLVAAFPQHVNTFSQKSYWGSMPEYRLLLENPSGELLAHLEFGLRTIGVGPQESKIAGIGAVATRPDVQGQHLGRALFKHLHSLLLERFGVDFGYLGCREAVVGFYQKVGFVRFDQTVLELNPDTGEWQESTYPNMVLPVCEPLEAWPGTGRVDLRGMPW